MLSGLTSQREIDGTKMNLSKGVILLFLSIIFKVAVAGNSTMVYFVELEIEKSVYSNVVDILGENAQINVKNATVTEITSTTDCMLNETHKNCLCMPGNTWSEDICKNHACCKDESCSLKPKETAVCLSDKRVSINGNTTMSEYDCSILCVKEKKGSDEYETLNQKIRDKLAEHYSTFKYFDSLIINGYSYGSVVVDYTVKILGPVSINELKNTAITLNGTRLVTTGLISIQVPEDQPIDIGSVANITCTPPEALGEVKWFLTDDKNKTTQITKGQEAKFTKDDRKDIVALSGISESWKGKFTCVYTQGTIEHKASGELDIALLPEIQARSTPQFPDCKTTSPPVIPCKIECNIPFSKENYTVTWDPGLSDVQVTVIQGDVISYTAVKNIYCKENNDETVEVSCNFTNNRSKSNSRKVTVQLPIIKKSSQTCEPNEGWPITKSNYNASKNCINSAVGLRTRECKNGTWQNEISSCVNKDLHVIEKDVQELNKGIGFIKDSAKDIFERIKDSTTIKTFNSFANINASISILDVMNYVSQQQKNKWNDTVIPDFVNSISNVLNDTNAWKNPANLDTDLSVKYLNTVEEMVSNSNLSSNVSHNYKNVELKLCNDNCGSFNTSVITGNGVIVIGFQNLHEILPKPKLNDINAIPETTILSITTVNNNTSGTKRVEMTFDYSKTRLPNHEMYCVFWNVSANKWSREGCIWGGATNAELCTCDHNSAFTILMSKDKVTLPYMEELTYVGLGISIVSLVLCLIIEILVWDAVVKSDISNFRHVAVFNIALCLLFAHCGFLASAEPEKTPAQWCSILTVVKHFFFLAVFFWMLCLSFVILHQIIFVFDHLRKRVFWGLSITLGYVCPILCVAITFITFRNGEAGHYYSETTCWLVYKGTLKGSIYAFILPVGTIVFINLFTLAVVIMKIATPTVSEAKARDEKEVAKSMIKTIVFLSPVLGITWIFGFFIMNLDLTQKPWAQVVNYTFTVLNSLQGFFILLTNCVGEKKVRDALVKRFKGSKQSTHSKSESSSRATSSIIKK
ncbi:adhesion G-protein coupled receptor F1 [Megalobrama amblycephala]|uniref:adhesion G-protein coupled receptor F1 n=1 Tax=Megalobrama amblycephala TaxID=75352 RepID=UPI0020147FB4|nr:adhesion G-protein coupled receptor F1 [Megalobrama amblycephala]